MCTQEMYGAYEDDLPAILTELGLLERIQRGEVKCAVCQKTITLDNLGAIARPEEETILCCNSAKCYILFGDLTGEQKTDVG